MLPSLSIIIVNWKSKDYVRKCLLRIAETCAELDPQIIVVDGGSFDGCGEMLNQEFPSVTFLQSPDNVGFGRSNNLGFEKATGEAVLLLNPDTEPYPGAIRVLLENLTTLPRVGILGARLLNSDGTIQLTSVLAFLNPLNQALRSDVLLKLFPGSPLWGIRGAYDAPTPTRVQAVSGACMMLWAETFRRIGGFSPEYFMYAEDIDLCARAAQLGLQNYHVPMARIIHHGGGSSQTQVAAFNTVMMRVAVEQYITLHKGTGSALLYRLLQGVAATVRLLATAPAALLLRKKRAQVTLSRASHVLRWCCGLHPLAKSSLPIRVVTPPTSAIESVQRRCI